MHAIYFSEGNVDWCSVCGRKVEGGTGCAFFNPTAVFDEKKCMPIFVYNLNIYSKSVVVDTPRNNKVRVSVHDIMFSVEW